MRVPRFRVTIRWLGAIAALIAVAFGGFVAGVRWERSRADADVVYANIYRAGQAPDLLAPPV